MKKDADLIILWPPSDKSKEYLNYCKTKLVNYYDIVSYANFVVNMLQNFHKITKENGFCCFVCHKNLCRDSTMVYSNVLSKLLSQKSPWEFLDEIILSNKGNNYGKIAILKKRNTLETMSRGERLFYVSIRQEEKDTIFNSIWTIRSGQKNTMDKKVIRWLILSYSNAGEKVLFPHSSKSIKKIITELRRTII